MFKLLIQTGEKKGTSYPIKDSVILIGRDSSNTITLPDRQVSRKHASISTQGSEFLIEDLGSANGTMLNNRLVQRQALKPGDEITLGNTVLVFTSAPDSEEIHEASEDAAAMVHLGADHEPIDRSTIEIAIPPQEVDSFIVLPEKSELSTLKKAYLRLSVMYRLINNLVTVTDFRALLDRTVEMVLKTIKADRALIMLVEGDSGDLMPEAMRWRKDEKYGREIGFSKTIAKRVLETGESILSLDAMKDQRFQGSDSIILHHIRSSLCVPIKTKSRILGIIHADTIGKVMGFAQADLEMLAAMGHQIGIAIENAKLVTELRKANTTLREQQAKLIEAEKLALLGKIAAGVAHEINNPIMSVLGFAGMTGKRLEEGTPSPEKITDCTRYLSIVQTEAQRCIQIVENISRFYRQKQSQMAPTRIQGVIAAALGVAKLQMNQKHIEIVTELSPDLPPVLANQGLLQQVLVNILLNAKDAMEKGGTLSVTAALESPQWVTIRISDTGYGIKPEDIQNIFTPSFTTKGEGKGTGLGLSISQEIIKSHNGTIEVESIQGKGTTFIIRLPSGNQSSTSRAG